MLSDRKFDEKKNVGNIKVFISLYIRKISHYLRLPLSFHFYYEKNIKLFSVFSVSIVLFSLDFRANGFCYFPFRPHVRRSIESNKSIKFKKEIIKTETNGFLHRA